MKFFSNEKENETQQIPDHEGRAASEPVTVPPQRAGSPWSDAPDSREDGPRNTDSQDPVDIDLGDSEKRDDTGDKATTTTTYGPDGSVVDEPTPRAGFGDRPGDELGDRPKDDADRAGSDEYDPDRTTAINSGEGNAADKAPEDEAIKDDGSFDSPKAVEPGTDEPLKDDADGYRDGEEFQPASDSAAPVAAAAAVPVASSPGTLKSDSSGTPKSGDKLLPDGDSFAERFRDIQLRFVDEPKEATAEAATLVGDAVDKLTSALKAQRDGLAGNSDDTEKLRVELRAYRDILNRLLALLSLQHRHGEPAGLPIGVNVRGCAPTACSHSCCCCRPAGG
jgi:hypothetical protein